MADVDLALVDELARLAADLDVAEQPHRTIPDGTPEPVLVGHWVEVLRHCLDGLEPGGDGDLPAPADAVDELDDGYGDATDSPRQAGGPSAGPGGATPATIGAALDRLVPSPGASPAVRRAWAVFLLDGLAELPSCPADAASTVIDLAISSLRPGDALVTRGTPLDDAIDGIIGSAWRSAFHTAAATAFVGADPAARRRLAFHLAASSRPPVLVLDDGSTSVEGLDRVAELCDQLDDADDTAVVLAVTDLLETFYREHGRFWPDEFPKEPACPDLLPSALRIAVFDALLRVAERQHPAASLAGWALLWLTLAKSPAGDGRDLTPERRARLRTLVADPGRDPFLRSDLAMLLAVDPPRPALAAQFDWIYGWAVIADSGEVLLRPPAAQGDHEDLDVRVVAELFTELSATPELVDRAGIAALALARLDGDGPATTGALLRRFLDPHLDADLRDEALVHLVRGEPSDVAPEVRVALTELARDRTDEGDEFDRTRAFLAIVGTGDVDAMVELLGRGQRAVGYDRAFARSLAASTDHAADVLLQELSLHPDTEIRTDALEELAQRAQS